MRIFNLAVLKRLKVNVKISFKYLLAALKAVFINYRLKIYNKNV